ncbi:translation machinery-associated protein 16-like [Mya arenaria]|uniref:translation machinery-associated protein 16-like n=1 Tax=Mya arenaria TaxID=6604 RepID=UPI0022E17EAA|nr:translation machinery-associated protein 16-like [Mya arenaria]XP_052785596.1 translation machinery-associated protein 16-like [Mya arenaria]
MPKAPKSQVSKAVHPHSRRATVLRKKLNREQRVMKSKVETTLKQDQLQQKLVWFQENLDAQKATYTKHELAELTSRYLNRFDDQLEQISIVNSIGNRQGNSHVARENAIKLTLETECHEFETVGIEVPDLINGKALSIFKTWTGEARYHPNIKLRRSKKIDLKSSENEELSEMEGDSKSVEADDTDLPDYVSEDDTDKETS